MRYAVACSRLSDPPSLVLDDANYTRIPTDSIGLGSRLPLFLALSFRVCVPPTRSPKPVVWRCRRRWSLPIISTHLARLSRHPIACDGSANFPIQFLVKSFSHQFHLDNLRNFSQFFGSLSCHVHPLVYPPLPTSNPLAEFQPPSAEGGIAGSAHGEGEGDGGPQLSRVVRGGTPGEFNLYIFAMSWKAEW